MIALIDSGRGTQRLEKLLRQKGVAVQVFNDTVNFPYGTKPSNFVIQRAEYLSDQVVKHGCTCIVLCCNTMTALALDKIETAFPIPVIGMLQIPNLLSSLSRVTILATDNTIASGMWQQALRKFNLAVTCLSKPKLVAAAQEGKADVSGIVAEELSDIKDGCPILFGCTHYSLLTQSICRAKPNSLIIDPVDLVAQKVFNLLRRESCVLL